jgi:hypothetical protein
MKKTIVIPISIVHLGEEGTHIFCKAKVNGIKARVLIDTGASKSVLAKSFADKLKKLKHVPDGDNTTSGIGPESVNASFAKLKSLEFKSLRIKKLVVGTIDVSHVVKMYKTLGVKPFDLILGGEVLEKYNAVIDYKKKVMVFSKK